MGILNGEMEMAQFRNSSKDGDSWFLCRQEHLPRGNHKASLDQVSGRRLSRPLGA